MKNNVIIINGATSMIGRAAAHLLSQQGAKLVLLGRSVEKLTHLADELNTDAITHAIDITEPADVTRIVEQTIEQFQRIDCVVHNSAIYPSQPIEQLSLSAWNQTLATTLTGPFLLTQACIKQMKKQRHGKLVFLSSIAGEQIGLPNMAAYTAAKAGLNGLMRTTALELARYNINVNSISPGKIYDPSMLTTQEITEKLHSVPLQRFVTPRDIAEMAAFLASAKANNITGQDFIIDGGQSIYSA